VNNNSHLSKEKLEYYRNLYNSQKEDKVLLETLADKLIGTLNMNILDFKIHKKQDVFVNRIRYKETILHLKKPLKLLIEKYSDGFSIIQEEINLTTYDKNFRQALKGFQEKFYLMYENYRAAKVDSMEMAHLKQFFCSFVDEAKS